MSDDNGDAAFEAEGSAATPPSGRDTSIDGRLETIHHALATLGSRIDALVTSTTTYRAALTDRLAEYTNVVSNLSRDQAADLEAYRQANERSVGELRRSLSDSDEVLERVGQRIDALLSDQEASAGDSRAVLTEVRSIVDAQETLSRTLRESLDQFSTRIVDELREALLDVASGEVVGALWDELRTARQSLDTLVAHTEDDADTAGDEQIDALRVDVIELTGKVGELLDQAEVVDGSVEQDETAGVLEAVAVDIAALRSELSEGLVVEPSEALSGTVDQLRAELAGLDGRMRSIAESIAESVKARETPRPDGMLTALAADLAAMRRELAERLDGLPAQLATATGADDAISDADIEGELQTLRSGVEGVDGELRALRTGVEDIIGRLDEGIALAEDITPPAAGTAPELGDQLATLRDQMTTEFDAVRQLMDGVASRAAPDAPPEAPALEFAALDPDVLDLLREEIRAAGGVSDEVITALRNDLVALRRRIKLRAEGELFTEEQLDHIAEAVARRMST